MTPTRAAEAPAPRSLRHESALVLVRAALVGAGLVVVDEVRLDPLLRLPESAPLTTRLSLARPGLLGLGYAVVETGDDLTSEVPTSSLDALPGRVPVGSLALTLRRWVDEGAGWVPREFDHASTPEVVRALEIYAALPERVRDLVTDAPTPAGEEGYFLEAVRSPEVFRRDRVLDATVLLTDLAAGAPLEWCLRRGTAEVDVAGVSS